MKRKLTLIIFIIWFGLMGVECTTKAAASPPILILAVDKLDSIDFFQSKLPGIRSLVDGSSCGLMSICSGSGYTKSLSGYLTMGSGVRSSAPDEISGVMEANQPFKGSATYNFWNWVTAANQKASTSKLLLPEFGYIQNQALNQNKEATPGLLGTLFHAGGWHTVFLGNDDSPTDMKRPGGLFLMDHRGVIDGGMVSPALNSQERDFPYQFRTDPEKVFCALQTFIRPRTLLVVEFSDFSRLDFYSEQMLPSKYQQLKGQTLRRFDGLLRRITRRWSPKELTILVVSPSISKESNRNKRLLAPVLVRSTQFVDGTITSGTTNWTGIVSNIDLLPTLLKLSGLEVPQGLDGRAFKRVKQTDDIRFLENLHLRINAALAAQRPILDGYLAIVTIGWLIGFICIFGGFGRGCEWMLTLVAVIPLTLIVLPLFPSQVWGIPGFLGITLLLGALFGFIKKIQNRFLILSFLLWLILVVDQVTGWNLIRFSALGYSPAAGARYYGMGNEFMGVFLPISLLLVELIYQKTKKQWPAWIILGLGILILGWPKWGINFGGTLAALIGFAFYLFLFLGWKPEKQKIALILGLGLAVVTSIGGWDALRAPEQQTHIGRFFHLIFSNHLVQILLILQRKLAMNLKLMIMSPWARIVWLALILSILHRLIIKKSLATPETHLFWQSALVAGIAAFALNDSGVVAFATGLTFAFSYLLITYLEAKRV